MEYQGIKNKPVVTVSSRSEWRRWLEANHAGVKEIWLVYYKKHPNIPSLTKAEATKEALCFGWIDSLVQGIDDKRDMQKFTPRNPDRIWSELNKRRVIKLESRGLMTAAGQKMIRYARESGEWARSRDLPEKIDMPKILNDALMRAPDIRKFWDELLSAHRKQFLWWISQANREQTRRSRTKKKR